MPKIKQRSGYVEKCVKVVFIPISGRSSHSKPKEYRSNSLTSFLLKIFEQLLDSFIHKTLKPEFLSKAQHNTVPLKVKLSRVLYTRYSFRLSNPETMKVIRQLHF